MSRSTFRWNAEKHAAHGGGAATCNPEDPCLEPFDSTSEEWILGGVRFGREGLDEMKRSGSVPMSDFTEHWARLPGQRALEENKQRRADIENAYRAVKQGYRPRPESAREAGIRPQVVVKGE